jgi:hypothetical protein
VSESDFSLIDEHTTYEQLMRMWNARDPMPPDLPETVLVALALDDLDHDYELLHLVQQTRELAGTRSQAEALTIVFSGVSVWLMMQVRSLSSSERRLDGWVSPARRLRVSVRQDGATWESRADAQGRFELPRLPSGLSRVVLSDLEEAPADGEPDADPAEEGESLQFATPAFEL